MQIGTVVCPCWPWLPWCHPPTYAAAVPPHLHPQPFTSLQRAGVIALTKTIAREYAGRNITCNAVAPGFIASGELEGRGILFV